jgi:hypothetical protein
MQIVIDIPKRTYEQLKFLREQGFDGFETIIDKAVANGTPLPKHHGRLIDADAMQKYQIDTFGQRLLVIDTAPTIIDAESEDKE